jgi:3',5'-cyclic-AMP phosphodiesterase
MMLLIYSISRKMYNPNGHYVKPLSDSPQISLGVISDVHLHAGKSDFLGFPYRDYIAEKKFASALQDLNNIDPHLNALVINGDLTATGMQTDYDSMNKILRKIPHSQNTFFAIGNH